jgi:hypothetical protein
MKIGNPLAKVVANEDAAKEMKRFLWLGWILSGVAIFAFMFLAVGGPAFGGRAAVLAYHEGTRDMERLKLYRLSSFGLIALSAFEVWVFLSL